MVLFLAAGTILMGFLWPQSAHGVSHLLDGTQLNLWWGLPFIGLLGSLAIFPLLHPRLWHAHFGKITLGWSLCILIPTVAFFGWEVFVHELLITYGLHYFPFIILAGSLFVIAGGIQLDMRITGRPDMNTLVMAIATLVASFMGTTGAAMLFIRPLLRTNDWRRYKRHTVIFFILLVCNVGGCLTALGDPPLFLGFLFGVGFFWPTLNLIWPFLVVAIPLLGIYFAYDTYLYRKEDFRKALTAHPSKKLVTLEGGVNVLLLLGVLVSVLISGIWKPGVVYKIGQVPFELQNIVRDFSLVGLSLASLFMTNQAPRQANQFSWEPLLEVTKLFAGIFITAAPVIVILGAGLKGDLAPLISLVSAPDGSPLNDAYFWMTGGLSAFLDNAPTYMVFFYMAGGDAEVLMTTLSRTLMAISAGAVFMGALTYIGNAPNFMVKAIAESRGIQMPSFFGYMLWSVVLLVPLFMVVSLIFF